MFRKGTKPRFFLRRSQRAEQTLDGEGAGVGTKPLPSVTSQGANSRIVCFNTHFRIIENYISLFLIYYYYALYYIFLFLGILEE